MSDDEGQLKVPTPNKNVRLSELKRQRGSLKTRLSLLLKFVAKYGDQSLSKAQKAELQLRMQSAHSFFDKFNDIQGEIEGFFVNDDDYQNQLEYRESFEEQFYCCMATAQCLIDSEIDLPKEHLSCSAVTYKTNVKLPDIKLPAFDGSYDSWLEFKNSYESMIHSRADLDPIHKFHYLKSSLSGSALQVIGALEFTASNYVHAWELLTERFHNHRLLVYNHVKSLFSMQAVNKESPNQIRKLIDSISRNLRALKTLNEPTDKWDTLMIYLLVSKLDSSTEREWENFKGSLASDVSAKLDDLLTFLRNRADMLEMVNINHNSKNKSNATESSNKKPVTHTQTHSYASTMKPKSNKNNRSYCCVMCKGNHKLYTCITFLNLQIKDRLKFVEDKCLCPNCLRAGHSVGDCFFGPCLKCQRKHNSLLHIDSSENISEALTSTSPTQQTASPSTRAATALHSLSAQNSDHANDACNAPQSLPKQVLLSTALVDVADNNNRFHTVRALLDNGSQQCFVSGKLAKRLNLKQIQSTVQVSGVGQSVIHASQSCDILTRSKLNDFNARVKCLILPCITSSLPSTAIEVDAIRIPDNVQLADPTFYVPGEIDLLIGADVFWDLLNEGKMRLSNGPYLQNTKLGWLISGPLYTNGLRINQVQCNFTQKIDDQLKRFWELEEIPNRTVLTPEEVKCEEIFTKTTKREDNGRFSVRMPLKESADSLGDSYQLAETRFLSLEKKLNRLPQYKQKYTDFINEYIELGHMSQSTDCGAVSYYLPHHGVLRESTTTSLRVVFDASAVTTSGKSLNDILLPGPKLQNDIFSILLRFRQYRYVACADIEKMFRQISIQSDQRGLQQILWRENPSDTIKIFQLNTVTYGTASAPYLSMRCLRQLAQECDDDVIARVIGEDFYVDDLITGSDDQQELVRICEKTSQVLKSACFPLRKWTLNWDISQGVSKELSVGDHTQSKTLGLGWLNDSDEFHFTTKIDSKTDKLTKRIMLSIVSQIYDPLGLLAPAVIMSKILLQQLWLSKLDWDDPIGDHIAESWHRFIDSLKYLHTIKIPRFVRGEHTQHTELHIFTDASESGFGSCAYVRSYNDHSDITVRLLCAKSKVAPLKRGTIARLELCGALTGAKLYKSIIDSLRLKFDEIYFWSDSTIVLGWLRLSPHLLNTFVQNRVTLINEITGDKKWYHVKSEDNPADLVSRGLYLDSLRDCSLWWNGPSFLYEHGPILANSHINEKYCDLPELRTKSLTVTTSVESEKIIDFDRFSSFIRLKRTGAYILRFIYNSRLKAINKDE